VSFKRKLLLTVSLFLLALVGMVQPLQLAHASLGWSSPILIDTHSGFDMLSSTLQASNGTLWLAWQSNRYGQTTGRFDVLYKTYTNGVWSLDRNITSSGQNASPSLVQLANGTISVFWVMKPSHSYDVFYSQYRSSGWTSPIQITNTNLNDTSPSAAVGRDGTVWLVWTRIDSTNHSVPAIKQLYYKTWKNGVWSTEAQLTSDTNQNYGSGVMVGKNGIVRVTWSKGAAGSSYQLYSKTNNGTVWSTETHLVSSASTDEHPSMIQDRNGTLWLFWGRLIVVSQLVQYYALIGKYSYNMGSAWSSEIALTNTSTSVDSFLPSAVQSSFGVKALWIFYTSNLNVPDYDIFALMSTGVSPVHDVTASGLSVSNNLGTSWEYPGGLKSVGQTAIVTIAVTIANIGDYLENAIVTLTATNTSSITIGTRTSLVGPGNAMNFYFYWNTTNVAPARYGLSVNIAALPGETLGNMGDNSYNITNQVHIIPLGDIDQNGSVTITDVSVFFFGFDFTPACGCSQWTPYADINNNGIIDIVDVSVAIHNFDTFT
jgi:hypothetical protein